MELLEFYYNIDKNEDETKTEDVLKNVYFFLNNFNFLVDSINCKYCNG